MRRGDDKRLARLESRLPPDPAGAQRSLRRHLRLLVAWGSLIHDMAAAAGIDTETIAALREAEQAVAELGALGDNAELAAADAAAVAADTAASQIPPGTSDPRQELLRRLRRIGASYAGGGRPVPNAPFMAWLGRAMAQRPLPARASDVSEKVLCRAAPQIKPAGHQQ